MDSLSIEELIASSPKWQSKNTKPPTYLKLYCPQTTRRNQKLKRKNS
jgi:hypothetical protein